VNPEISGEVQIRSSASMPEQHFFRHQLREQVDLKNPAVRLAVLNNRKRLLTLMSESFVSGKRVNS
jgi:hypothetical protein